MVSQDHITVIGSGYVGLTTGVCLSSLGHVVTCVDRDPSTIAELRAGRTHLAEPDLATLLGKGIEDGTLRFDDTAELAVAESKVVILCLPTPSDVDGAANLDAIEDTVHRIRSHLTPGTALITKSTVPVGTGAKIRKWLSRDDVTVVANPEFLREGHSVHDFLHPARILIGADDTAAAKRVASLYDGVRSEIILTDTATAELAKYASNSFLATKLSYVNTLAELCEVLGADVRTVTQVMGADPRIGADFLRIGPGWGGPCLPKDTRALLHQSRQAGLDFPLLDAAITSNDRHHARVVTRLETELDRSLRGARIGVLGLAFKAGTNDLRDSPAVRITRSLVDLGAIVTVHDPTVQRDIDGVTVHQDVYNVAREVDGLLLLTDWPQYASLDWGRLAQAMTGSLVLDTRAFLNAQRLADARLRCVSLGSGIPPK